MNIYAWIGLIGIVIAETLPFIQKNNRTRSKIIKASISVFIVLCIILAVLEFRVSFLIAFGVGFLAMIALDKKTYTKKRLFIYIPLIIVIGAVSYVLFREQADYVLNHLKKHPHTSSLYVAENNMELITYEADIVRPLASTVKIMIALEYAYQVNEGKLDPNETVDLTELAKFYFTGTDGGAHEAWLESLKDTQQQVTLHEVAQGMIMYSSNANTDYMIHLLGTDQINERAKALGLTNHDEIYPLVGALYISQMVEDKEEIVDMSMEEYRELAYTYSEDMKNGRINLANVKANLPMDLQNVWSDRLIGSTAREYGQLLAMIQHN